MAHGPVLTETMRRARGIGVDATILDRPTVLNSHLADVLEKLLPMIPNRDAFLRQHRGHCYLLQHRYLLQPRINSFGTTIE